MPLAFSLALAAVAAAPCGPCLHWLASVEQAARLAACRDRLDGVDLVIDAEPPADLVATLQAQGARTGLLLGSTDLRPPSAAFRRVIVSVAENDAGARKTAFELKQFATAVRARGPEVEVGAMGTARALAALDAAGLGPYLDFAVAIDAAGPPSAWRRLDRLASPTLSAALEASAAGRHLLIDLPAGAETVAVEAARIRDRLPEGLSPLPAVSVRCAGCASSVYLDPRTLEAVAVVHSPGPIRDLAVAPAGTIVESTEVSAGGLSVVRIAGWAGEDRFTSGVDVEAERPLTVEEIIARHQARAARQRRRVRSLISSGSTVVTFQVPGLSAPMTVAADTVLYETEGRREVEYRSLRLNGLELVGAGRAPLPIVEPERWAAPPLAIELDQTYRYRLEGRERVSGRDCYVVRFAPRVRGRALPSGRAWIERAGFALARLETVQSGLRGAIVSSRERDDFAPVPVDGREEWLLARSDVEQLYEGAGHRTPVHRVIDFQRHEPNPPEFERRLADAEASPSVMLEQTGSGVHYLQPASGEGSRRRVPAGTGSRVTAVALGFLVDPNITRRLPFAGVSYSDLDFFGTGAQVSVFLAGAFARAAWSAPSLGGWRLEGSAFASLVTYNDRAFRAGIERYDENLRQRPARASVELARPIGGRWRVRAAYELSHTSLSRSETTAADFVLPLSPTVHGLRLELETQRGPWTAAAWFAPAWRRRWAAWGAAETMTSASYERWGATAARTFVWGPRGVARVEASWLGGRRLDRFSRYGFDGFENRLRGYPGASIRFDRAAVLRGSATRELARGVRAEGYFDAALVRDAGFGGGLRSYSGLGGGLQAALPLRALVSIEWGHGFQAVGPGGRRGTNAFQLTVFKPI